MTMNTTKEKNVLARIGLVAAYVATVVAANYATAHYAPWFVGAFVITAGTWFIGVTFVLRDAVQLAFDKTVAYAAIVGALVINAIMSVNNSDLRWITIGSTAAFAVSETLDTEAFSRMRAGLVRRVAFSGWISGLADSIVFAVVGLSPLTTGIIAWGDLWRVVLAQVVVKSIVVTVCATPFYAVRLRTVS